MAYWRTKINQNDKECTERNTGLKEEKDAIQGHFQELKGRMTTFRKGEILYSINIQCTMVAKYLH